MRIAEIDTKSLVLTGITLNSSFTILNSHQILAVMFEIECHPPFLQIEPERGMILQKEKKIIKVRVKPEMRSQAVEFERRENKLIINSTYFSEYNRKMMQRSDLIGWNTISKEIESLSLPVYLSVQEEMDKIKSSIKRDDSLKNSRKMNSFQKFKENSVKKLKNEKLNEDLDFIFRNQVVKSKYSYPNTNPMSQSAKRLNSPDLNANNLKKGRYGQQKNSFEVSQIHHAQARQIPQFLPMSVSAIRPITNIERRGTTSRAYELIILAAIAGIFVAIGETIGSLTK